MAHDLADEYGLLFFPVTLGQGKRLFDRRTMLAAFALNRCSTASAGVVYCAYRRASESRTGSFELQQALCA
jgi:dihydrofolate reductase